VSATHLPMQPVDVFILSKPTEQQPILPDYKIFPHTTEKLAASRGKVVDCQPRLQKLRTPFPCASVRFKRCHTLKNFAPSVHIPEQMSSTPAATCPWPSSYTFHLPSSQSNMSHLQCLPCRLIQRKQKKLTGPPHTRLRKKKPGSQTDTQHS